jgi:hypothetical protein
MARCIIGHEIRTEGGFKVYETGVDYPDSDIDGREKYFEITDLPDIPAEINEEVKP